MEILKGKIALITGASGGIGSCIARRFAQDGISLALLGRSKEKLAATAASVREYGVETLLLPGDLLDDAYLEDCFAAVKERFGGLDILVNNAGIALSRSFEETTMTEFDRIMALNARVPYLACHLALPLLRCSECASILNIASVVARTRAIRCKAPTPPPSTRWPGSRSLSPARSTVRISASTLSAPEACLPTWCALRGPI